MELTQARLKELLYYDPETGALTWKICRKASQSGKAAGRLAGKGYLQTTVAGRAFVNHRLAWLYMYGRWPAQQIDHINRVKTDNRLCNLREVTPSENLQNQNLRASSQSGFTGVGWHKATSKWAAYIRVDNKQFHLGVFDTPQLASEARAAAKHIYHPTAPL